MKSNIKVYYQSLQLIVIRHAPPLLVLVTITLGLLVTFILKESSAELVPFPDHKGNFHK